MSVRLHSLLHSFKASSLRLQAVLVQAVVREGDKCTRLFILDQGTLSSKGRMLEAGAVVGVQHFLLSRNRWSHAVTTVTYSRLQSLDKDTFDE